MLNGGSEQPGKPRVVVLTADSEFEQSLRTTFASSGQLDLSVVSGGVAASQAFDFSGVSVIVADLDANQPDDFQALQRLVIRLGERPPIIVVTQAFNETVGRQLLQVRVADFLVKPVAPIDLARACARVAQDASGAEVKEAQIYTFLPAVGGAGVTTLAIQTAMILLNHGQRGKSSTCLVDLDFQHGACADYLDIEPRLNLGEIEPRPERLDRQLLEVMLSHHHCGLAVVAAPHHLAEMRSFDPDVVTRLLDLVSSNFDYVVFDMPRTWFSWTDSVLLGSNNLFIVCEMTVPGLRHAKHLVEAIRERLEDGAKPQVIVNRFEQRMFSSGLRKADIAQVLGESFAGYVPNHYSLVREAIDRGVPIDEVKPGNQVTAHLRKLIVPQAAAKAPARPEVAPPSKAKLTVAR